MMPCVVLCYANVVIEYDRRRSGLRSAPLDVEYDNNNNRNIAMAKHTTYNITLKIQ